MSVEDIGALKGQEGADGHHEGAEDGVSEVEVEVGVARRNSIDEPVIGILGGIPRHHRTEGGAHFHTLEDEVDAKLLTSFHGLEVGAHDVFLPDTSLLHLRIRPHEGDMMVASVTFDPALILLCPVGQSLLGDGVDAFHFAKEINDVVRPGQQRQVSLDDETIETVVYQT